MTWQANTTEFPDGVEPNIDHVKRLLPWAEEVKKDDDFTFLVMSSHLDALCNISSFRGMELFVSDENGDMWQFSINMS